jgi:hypothetical protein
MPHESHQSTIEACNDCAMECEHCASACLAEQDIASLAHCIRLDLDCATFCRTAAELMSRGSQFASQFCELCAQVCDACATECEKHPMDHCRACAEACRRCAAECRRMAQARGSRQKGEQAHAAH